MEGIKFSQDVFHSYLVTMIIQLHLAFRTVQNIAFQKLVWLLRPGTSLPSESSIKREVMARAKALQEGRQILQDLGSLTKVNISLDLWSDRWRNSYLALNC